MKEKSLKFNIFLGFLFALVSMGIFGSSQSLLMAADEKDPITGETYPEVFTVGTLNGAPQTAIAIEEGYFDQLSVPVKVLFFDSGRDVNTAFAAKSIQAGSFGSSPISLGISNNLGYEVVFVNDVIGKAESLAVRKSSNIKKISDVKGKKIAAPFASTAHYSLLNALILAKIDPKEVTLLDMQPQDILAAWIRGDIDGAYVWTPVLEELLKHDGISITDSGELATKGATTADLTAVNSEFAKKYPTLVTQYVKAFVKSYEIFKNEPDRADNIVAKHLDIDKETAKQQLAGNNYISAKDQISSKYLGQKGKAGDLAKTLKSTADFHVDQKNLEKAGELSVYQGAVNGSFVEAALK